ncbi:MAG: carotenoid biosynthesis protein [Pelagibacterales bacterium]|nr:carotenoid biosynthesis protein [Pelagibacterales bacterium]
MLTKLYKNKELLRFSVFFVWLINISGFFGVLSDQKEFFLSTSPFAILITFILLVLNYDFKQKGFISALISIISIGFLVEFLGVNYDLFFGSYEYGDNLGYKIGGVPIIMSINWLVLIFLTGSFAEKIIPNSLPLKVLFASLLMVFIDVFLEICAPKLDYWKFNDEIVPMSNYNSWFIISAICLYIYFRLIKDKEHTLSTNVLVIHFAFFGLLSVFL